MPKATDFTDDVLREFVRAFNENGCSVSATARVLALTKNAVEYRKQLAALRGLLDPAAGSTLPQRVPTAELEVGPAPDPDEPIETLLARKKAMMARAVAHDKWAQLIPVVVKQRGPIGLALIGDPHIDDDHCDIHQLEHDLSTVGKTKGFFAGHVGDLTNNWVGRLKALYANQSTRYSEGLRLVEWMLGLCPNLFLVGGNHDMWEQGMDLLRFIGRQQVGAIQPHGARMALNWPDGFQLRVHCRHDFPGRSQFSDTHGMKREILFGHRDHILVAGHTHVDEARIEPSLEGECHWFFRVSGYKSIDDFAKQNGFRPKRMGPATFVVIDPSARVPAEVVKPFWDVERAADYLKFLQQRRGSN